MIKFLKKPMTINTVRLAISWINVKKKSIPYKLTFVLKGMDDRSIPYARDRYMNLREKAV